MTPKGVIVAGQEYELDCLISTTGYAVGTEYVRRAGYDVIARDGIELGQHWKNGMRTLQGLFIHGFPNLFMLEAGQSAGTFSVTFMLTEQAKHLARLLQTAIERGASTVEPTLGAVEDYVAEIWPLSVSQQKFWRECTPYFTAEGENDNPHGIFTNVPPVGPVKFHKNLEEWRNTGDFDGLTFA
jgi:hypothetical protein